MSSPADWQASAVQVAGLIKQVKARGLDAKVLAMVSAPTREAFENPYSTRWHSGEVLVEFSEAFAAVAGPAGLEELNYDMARASFGPILRPMIQVALAITGRSPATLFARVPASIEQALKNVICTWTPSGPNSGALSFVYPCSIKPNTEHAWRGALRFVSGLTGTASKVDQCEVTADAVHFKLSW